MVIKDAKDATMDLIRELRAEGREFRAAGDKMFMHAAYRSARTRVRSLRKGVVTIAPCFCDDCLQEPVL